MGIGASLGLIAIGAILKFAFPEHIAGIGVGMIGVILMIVGILGLVVTTVIWGPRSRRPADPDLDRVEERRVYDRRPPL
jgi:hypothetical protein